MLPACRGANSIPWSSLAFKKDHREIPRFLVIDHSGENCRRAPAPARHLCLTNDCALLEGVPIKPPTKEN